MQRGDPVELRHKEHSERGSVIDQLVYCISSYREAAMSNDSKFDHIEIAEKEKVVKCQYFFILSLSFYIIIIVYCNLLKLL